MNNLLMQEGLFALLRQAARNPRTPVEAAAWDVAYEAFRLRAADTTDRECTPAVLRTIEQARLEAAELLRHLRRSECLLAQHYCRKALGMLDAERRIVLLRIRHPDFAEQIKVTPGSPLYLNEDFHPSDLVELIIPLYHMGFCRTANHKAVQSKTLVAAFEWIFNTPLPNYNVLRYCVLNRKIRLTPLLDRMRDTLIELSQR